MNTVVHLRKLCNHPFLFENVEDECRDFWKMEITGYVVAGLRVFFVPVGCKLVVLEVRKAF